MSWAYAGALPRWTGQWGASRKCALFWLHMRRLCSTDVDTKLMPCGALQGPSLGGWLLFGFPSGQFQIYGSA